MSKHTPGPWYINISRGIWAESQQYGKSPRVIFIAKMERHRPGSADHICPDEIQEANARLIIGAPTMYQKLADTVEWLDREIKGWDMAIKNEAREGMLEVLTELRDDLAETLRKIQEG